MKLFFNCWRFLIGIKGKFFSEDIMLLVGSPYFANILLSLCTEKMFRSSKMFAKHGDPASFILSSEKNLPLKVRRKLIAIKNWVWNNLRDIFWKYFLLYHWGHARLLIELANLAEARRIICDRDLEGSLKTYVKNS